METEEQLKKAKAYNQIIETLRECSSDTKKEFAEKFTGQDLNLL